MHAAPGRRPPRPQRQGLGVAGATLLLLPLLGGCSGTPFGEALSRSFSPASSSPGTGQGSPSATSAGASAPAPSPSTPSPAPATPPASGTTANTPGSSAAPPRTPAVRAGSAPGSTIKPAAGQAGQSGPLAASRPAAAEAPAPVGPTAPYRVTIRLPLADPSAPAEVVTQALRRAGVPFEVETIERVGGSSSTPTASGSPGPAATPQVRPAPPPR